MQLTKYLRLTAVLNVETGLRIGGASDKVEIGGVELVIVKNPLDGKPYIPGSSLKGKLRSLMQYELGKVAASGKFAGGPWTWDDANKDPKDPIIRIFGVSGADEVKLGPTRFVARDAKLTPEFQGKLPVEIVEVKFENTINRLTGTATNPRQAERIPAGVQFDVEFIFRVFDGFADGGKTDEDLFNHHVPRALELLEMDCLGGYGSRGYGKVSFSKLLLTHSDSGETEQFANVAEFKAKKSGKAAA